jgi:hypothetical protein
MRLLRCLHRIAPIVPLLIRRRPSAIVWRVGSVVVDSVQGHPARSRTHVVQKRLEAADPLGAHRDAATTVARIFRVLRVQTAALCSSPARILAGVPLPVRHARRSGALITETAAARGESSTERGAGNGLGPAADTSADPHRAPTLRRSSLATNHGEPAEHATGQIARGISKGVVSQQCVADGGLAHAVAVTDLALADALVVKFAERLDIGFRNDARWHTAIMRQFSISFAGIA